MAKLVQCYRNIAAGQKRGNVNRSAICCLAARVNPACRSFICWIASGRKGDFKCRTFAVAAGCNIPCVVASGNWENLIVATDANMHHYIIANRRNRVTARAACYVHFAKRRNVERYPVAESKRAIASIDNLQDLGADEPRHNDRPGLPRCNVRTSNSRVAAWLEYLARVLVFLCLGAVVDKQPVDDLAVMVDEQVDERR